jgi:alkyl hydroperoxide reductase subunit AhpC
MRPQKVFSIIIAAAFAVSLTGGRAFTQEKVGGTYSKIPTVKGIETLTVGTQAPDFKVRDIEGKEFHLKECCGKDAVLLFFWSFFCGPCREEMPMINQMTFDELVGDSFLVADPYGVAGTPALFIIDKKGTVTFTTLGALTGKQLETEIEKVIK